MLHRAKHIAVYSRTMKARRNLDLQLLACLDAPIWACSVTRAAERMGMRRPGMRSAPACGARPFHIGDHRLIRASRFFRTQCSGSAASAAPFAPAARRCPRGRMPVLQLPDGQSRRAMIQSLVLTEVWRDPAGI